jgi:LacI family transcriptional regulator
VSGSRVTVHDVARHAGVSPITVSRVINGSSNVRADTRRRVRDSVSAIGYVPNGVARALKRGRAGSIGLILPEVADPAFALITRGAEDVAWRAGYHLILCNSRRDPNRERDHVEKLLALQVEGVLVAPVDDRSHGQQQLLRRSGVPFVSLDASIGTFNPDCTSRDDVACSRHLINHLIALGHRRMGVVLEGSETTAVRKRLEGYREALGEADRLQQPELPRRPGAIRGQLLALLALPDPPTAIFALRTETLLRIVDVVQQTRMEIPRKLALACLDGHGADSPEAVPIGADIPTDLHGAIGARLLLDRLGGRDCGCIRIVVLRGASSAGTPGSRGAQVAREPTAARRRIARTGR